MRLVRSAVFVSLVAISCLIGSAQTTPSPSPSASPEDPAKRAKLDALIQQALDDAITNTTSLRLPENRALSYATLGDMYWRFDQKRARELFRNVGPELSAYNADVEKESVDQNAPLGVDMTLLSPDPRYQAIPLIAKHDAEFATQVMQQTRRAAVSQAIANTAQLQQASGIGSFGIGPNAAASARAAQELALEQQIALYAADQDPDAAIRAIKDSLARGLSYNILPMLQKLQRLDEKKAADLAGDVVQKVIELDMTKNTDILRMAIYLLQSSINLPPPKDPRDRQFNFTDPQQKDIANKLAASVLAMPATSSSNTWFTQVLPITDKLLPDRSAALKQRQIEIQKSMPTDIRARQQGQDMFNSSMTAEQIVALLPKLPDENKNMAYAALTNKIRGVMDEAQAKRLIDQIPDEKVRESLEQAAEAARADREMQTGKLDDARKQIAQMTNRRQQLSSYVNLAIAYNKSGKEGDIDIAKSILRDAKALTSNFPDSGDDLNDLMELVRGYTVIDTETAFKTIEPGIDLINQYVESSAVLSKFNKDRGYRNGELVFRQSGYPTSLAFRYLPQLQMLGKADFDRANQLIDRFSRPDSRMIARLYLLQAATPPTRTSVAK
jgi:hypothetical protein